MSRALALDEVVRTAWLPVALTREIAPGAVRAVVLAGREVVLWRGERELHAWEDLCLHRGVRLSLGRVVDGCALRCAYHGWTYDGEGRCTHMPAHPSMKPPSRARTKIYACRERGGLAWVSLGGEENTLPFLAEFDDPAFRAVPCGPWPVAAGAPRLIENFLDVAHLPIVHEGTLGETARAEIQPYEVEWVDGRPIARDIRLHQPNPEGLTPGGEVAYEYGVLSPFSVYLRKRMDGGRVFTLLFAVAAVAEAESVGYFTMLLNYGSAEDDAGLVDFQRGIFAQDVPIVTSQRPERLPLDLAGELHLPSDRLAIAYRQYIRELGLTFGTE